MKVLDRVEAPTYDSYRHYYRIKTHLEINNNNKIINTDFM